MVADPASFVANHRVSEVVLADIVNVSIAAGSGQAGDNIAFFINKAIFPVVATNYVADIIPSISFGKFGHFGEGVCWGLAINNFVELVGVT